MKNMIIKNIGYGMIGYGYGV